MANKILINATSGDGIRIAIIRNDELSDFDLQSQEHFRTKSNIYKGVVTRIEPSLEAVFVNYGEDKNGFLPAKEIIPEYLSEPYNRRSELRKLVKVGQEMIVQVDKEARKDKGAALTTYVTIASRFIVINRGSKRLINISRNIKNEERNRVDNLIKDIGVPKGFGCIVRTAAAGRSGDELRWDMDYVSRLWENVIKVDNETPAPALIIQESDVINRTLRDQLIEEFDEIVVDTQEVYKTAQNIISQIAPSQIEKINLYESNIPIFTHYNIEKTVQSAFQHIVKLPSGGQLVFDRTEAMFIIDVNSSQSNKGANVEDTALTNNMEAVKEIALQMKIRDIGGLIVIDFIDMMERKNRAKVEEAFNKEVYKDKAYVRLGNISRFGMMELSRQRLRSSLDEFYLHKCPLCNGAGSILTTGALAAQIFRKINGMLHNTLIKSISCEVPKEVYDVLNKSYAEGIEKLKGNYKDKVNLIANPNLQSPQFKLSYTDIKGVSNIINEDYDSENDSANASPSNIKRNAIINATDIMGEVRPNKKSFWGKISDIIKNLFPAKKPKYKKKRYKRYADRKGRRAKGRAYISQSRQGGNKGARHSYNKKRSGIYSRRSRPSRY